jgi:hypothetical protein
LPMEYETITGTLFPHQKMADFEVNLY